VNISVESKFITLQVFFSHSKVSDMHMLMQKIKYLVTNVLSLTRVKNICVFGQRQYAY
jgi:type III secretory pathway lipoprotein EscJ